MTTENIEAVCVWQDSQGDRTDSGDYPWIVSLDVLDDAGRAVTTRTLDVCDTEDEALASGRDSAAEHGLPLYANPANGAAECLMTAGEIEVAAYIASHDDDSTHDEDDLRRLFGLAFGREPDADDMADGLWSHLVASAE